MKLLVDMNLSPRWVDVLADAGIEAAHWSAVGAFTPSTQKSWPISIRTTAWCSLTIWISARSSLPPTVKSRAWCRFARRMSARTRSASKSSLPCDKWLPNLKKVRCSWSIRTARACACCHCTRGDEGRSAASSNSIQQAVIKRPDSGGVLRNGAGGTPLAGRAKDRDRWIDRPGALPWQRCTHAGGQRGPGMAQPHPHQCRRRQAAYQARPYRAGPHKHHDGKRTPGPADVSWADTAGGLRSTIAAPRADLNMIGVAAPVPELPPALPVLRRCPRPTRTRAQQIDMSAGRRVG